MSKKNKISATRNFQKAMHRFKVLDLIRTTGLISRIDLARQTGLSQASVTGITADLLKEGLIEEKKAGAYEGGRRPILLAVKPDGVHSIGVNLTINQIRIVIINFEAEVKASHTVPLEKHHYSPEELVEIIAQEIQACMWEANFSKDQIIGVGVGIPGPVDHRSGVVRFLPNYGWKEVPFCEMLQNRINHPVFLDNSSNNLAISEFWHGKGKGVDNFFVVTIENGVGAGTILNGQLIRGSEGIASEFGHTCYDPDGPECRCGRFGCLEAFVGNNSIIRDARKLVVQGNWSADKADTEPISLDEVVTELSRGNSELTGIYHKAGTVLGQGLYNLITLLNPSLIIITGKGVLAGDHLFDPMFATLEKLQQGKFVFPNAEIIIHEWDDTDWARGAGALVLREVYKSPAET